MTSLLDLCIADLRDRIIHSSTEIELVQGATLTEAGAELDFIYLPLHGVISVLATYASGDLIEVATVGREGFVGISAVLGGRISPGTHVVQMPGNAYAMPRKEFARLYAEETAGMAIFKRYADVFLYQVMISAACNAAHPVDQRLARWLLMMVDRSNEDTVTLTHEFLADMLNVRRASVTDSLGRLEAAESISRRRGHIVLEDRTKLTHISCDCYEMVKNYRTVTLE